MLFHCNPRESEQATFGRRFLMLVICLSRNAKYSVCSLFPCYPGPCINQTDVVWTFLSIYTKIRKNAYRSDLCIFHLRKNFFSVCIRVCLKPKRLYTSFCTPSVLCTPSLGCRLWTCRQALSTCRHAKLASFLHKTHCVQKKCVSKNFQCM